MYSIWLRGSSRCTPVDCIYITYTSYLVAPTSITEWCANYQHITRAQQSKGLVCQTVQWCVYTCVDMLCLHVMWRAEVKCRARRANRLQRQGANVRVHITLSGQLYSDREKTERRRREDGENTASASPVYFVPQRLLYIATASVTKSALCWRCAWRHVASL